MYNLPIFRKIIVLAGFVLIAALTTYQANAGIGIGVFAGIATPNDQINNVYNSDKLYEGETVNNLVRDAAATGFDLGVKLRLPVNDNLKFIASASWVKFPKTEIKVSNSVTHVAAATLVTEQSIIPIAAGINYYPLGKGLAIYGTGEVTYNHFCNKVEITNSNGFTIKDQSPTYTRFGLGLGAGIDLNFSSLTFNLEAKYNFSNLFCKDDYEEAKNYLTLNVGLYLGSNK